MEAVRCQAKVSRKQQQVNAAPAQSVSEAAERGTRGSAADVETDIRSYQAVLLAYKAVMMFSGLRNLTFMYGETRLQRLQLWRLISSIIKRYLIMFSGIKHLRNFNLGRNWAAASADMATDIITLSSDVSSLQGRDYVLRLHTLRNFSVRLNCMGCR